jgi:lipoprotein-releasing system ATP-binding protein
MVQLAVEGLSKVYQDAERRLLILDNLSFEFPNKGSLAIVGASGVGKSTLLHLLGGLDAPSGGRVLYDGVDIAALSSDAAAEFRGKNIGFVFQFHHLLPEFSALENVALPLIIAGVSADDASDRAAGILASVGMSHRLSQRPGTLSGGEQQRVAIARAIVTEPKVVLADEPTGNLDPSTAAQVQAVLLEITERLQSLLIVVTHNPELARAMDHIVEMESGGRLASRGKAY